MTIEAPLGKTVTLPGLLTREILAGIIGNLALNLLACWMLFPVGAPVTVYGWPGLALDLLPATALPALMMTIGVTAALRRRQRGGLRVEPSVPLPFALPRSIALRALAIAALALGLVALPTLIALLLLWPAGDSWALLIVYKSAFSLFNPIVMTPIMVLAAIEDGRRR